MTLPPALVYPERASDRDRWILERRGPRLPVDPDRPFASLLEPERLADGTVGNIATLFLTNRECPWHCAMCDLWRHTLTTTVPAGAIPTQIRYALAQLPRARQIKLYNSGSFFDPHAIPPEDLAAIAAELHPFERVIVECHPALISPGCLAFQQLIPGRLEVAMGLETAHPETLQKLNKRMTVAQYRAAAAFLREHGIDLRTFILIQPPFLDPELALTWACRSVDVALECGATAITLIPTRSGNGAVDELARAGLFTPPHLSVVEAALAYGITTSPEARVFVDLWEIDQVPACPLCRPDRIERLRSINLSQSLTPPIACLSCEAAL